MPPTQPASKQVLTIIVVAMMMAVFIYIGLTYILPGANGRPAMPEIRLVLLAVALISTVIALVVERVLLDNAKAAPGVLTAVVVVSALAEVSAVLGLMYFFLVGRREWVFFVLSLLSYARILLRLPEYHRLMDQF